MATGMVAFSERATDGSPVLVSGENERIAHVAHGIGIVLGDGPLQQNGTLYITTMRLIWLSDENLHTGYAVSFLSLSMHAISRDPNAYPVPCIYTQIENGDEDSDYEEADEIEIDEALESNHLEENLSRVAEMRLVPRDTNALDQIFQVLCDCALLNPDPVQEQEGEGDWYYNIDEVMSGRAIDEEDQPYDGPDISELQIQDSRFEDAEEEPDSCL